MKKKTLFYRIYFSFSGYPQSNSLVPSIYHHLLRYSLRFFFFFFISTCVILTFLIFMVFYPTFFSLWFFFSFVLQWIFSSPPSRTIFFLYLFYAYNCKFNMVSVSFYVCFKKVDNSPLQLANPHRHTRKSPSHTCKSRFDPVPFFLSSVPSSCRRLELALQIGKWGVESKDNVVCV